MISLEFSAAAAKKQADDGRREQWIYRYLQAGEWANVGLLEGLQSQQRWWIGPLEIELGLLKRCCGPEPDMEYRVPQMAWDRSSGNRRHKCRTQCLKGATAITINLPAAS